VSLVLGQKLKIHEIEKVILKIVLKIKE